FSGMTASIGAAGDLQEGFFDRLRSLPVPRVAIAAGRVVADTVLATIGLTVTTLVGFAMGFRTSAPVGALVAAVALCVFAAFAFTWMFVLLGLIAGNPQAAQSLGLLVFPFTFVSSAFVPVQSMPGWMQAFANNQPLTQIVSAVRAFTLGDKAQRVLGHPAGYFAVRSLIWCALFIAVFAPLAARRYQRG
ncbi:MAG: ABC transporter permease, partial [Actinomycetota bacterium]|nr:ABC transporter permease [Actinomycetota bacterium]